MPTDAQRRNIASAHHAEVQALNEKIAALTAENTRLEGLVYTPGLWRCAKCNFVLVQRNLNANSGTITARDQPGDKCPNCDVNLWRITERENARDNYETAERLHIELNEAKGFIARLEAVEAAARNLVKVKGRYHTEQAFKALAALVNGSAAITSTQENPT
jgi:methionyl-tRNA synthetase